MKKILFSFFLLMAVRLLAVSPVPYTESVSFSFKLSGTGSASMNLYDEAGSQYILATASGSTIESAMGAASLRPGKTYSLEFWGDGPTNYLMSFIPPTGYSVYVNGVATDLVGQAPGGGWFLHYYTVEIRPSGSGGGVKWGGFSGVSLGKSITWEVGLGDLRTGRGAGSILFKELDLANSPASRSRLYYAAPPANVGQIVVIKDGASNQTLRQIVTPIGFTDIVDVSGGYEIRCYFWSQVASWNGTLYTFTGSPWRTIKVESPAANQLTITETEGSVVRVSKLTGSGSTSNTGGSISYAGNYAVHTFTSGGTLSVGSALSGASWLVVGGGGGGGYGGGGAGSMEYLAGQSLAAGSYSVTIGSGGASATNGGNSTFNGTTAYGGGRGATGTTAPGSGGSSGGGCANNNTGAPPASGSGSNIHWGGGGDNGGNGWRGGGGGGAGGDGLGLNNSSGASQGTGGPGLANSITGSSVTYAGGGAGNCSSPLAGGSGGGGNSNGSGQTGSAGAANTGSGGGGGDNGSGPSGGNGGSGVVIVRYPVQTMTWTLQEGDSTNCVRTTVHTITFPASGQRDDVAAVYTTTGTYASPTNTLVAKTKYHYVNQSWGGEELESVTTDPDASNPSERTTTYTYHNTSSNKGNYRLVKSVTAPTGGWTAYEYYDDWDRRGRVKYQFQPWLDTPSAASSASTTTGRVSYYEYTTDWTGRYTRPTLREERINNTLVGKTTWSHGDNTGSGEPRTYATINSYRDASNYHSDYTETYRADADPDFAGQLYQAKGANLAQVAGSVSRGTYNPSTKVFTVGSGGDHWRELKFNGSTSSTGADSVTTFDSQSCPAVYLIPYKSTLDVTIRIAQGYVYRVEKWVYTGSSSFSRLTSEDFEYDAYGHLTQRWASNGALTNHTYTNGRLTSTTDPTGTKTLFTSYDAVGRVLTSVKEGASAGTYAAQGDITTTTTYDGANHVKQVVVSGGGLSQTTTSTYDLAGRLTQSVAPGGYTTGHAYSSGGKIVTTTFPGGATQVTEAHPDGQAKQVTGTAVVSQYTSYTLNTSPGTVTRQVIFGASSSTNLVKTTADWLGRPITEVRPGWSGSDVTTTNYYNGANQLFKVSRPGMADTLYTYDTLGALFRECLDVGANGAIDLASSDRITEHNSVIISGGGWWLLTTNSTYAASGSGAATQTSKTQVRLDLGAGYFDQRYLTDVFGNSTYQSTTVDRANKLLVNDTLRPDSSIWAHQVTRNGLLMSSKDTTNLTTTFGYDALGRQTTSVDPRTGTTTTAYVSGTSQVSTVTDPASIVQATYAYDSAGRVSSVKDALNKYAYTSYTTRGEVYRQWGDTTVPVEYGYDNWGRRTTMNTYRGGTGWTAATWPGSPGTADVTRWNFHEPTGLLSSKVSAYGTADAKTVSYTYTQAGQIDVRTWARSVTTDYDYSSTTGELLTVNYSDSTPDLTYTYNRLGNQATVTDVTGTRTLNYNLSGTLELQNEVLPSGYYGDRRITRGYDTATGVVGRYNRLAVGSAASPYGEYDQSYSYDTYGRLNGTLGAYTYSYQANSNLLSGISHGSWAWTQSRSYLSNRDLLDVIETKWSTASKAKFDYASDNLGRRTGVAKTGELFTRYGNGTQGVDTTWGYDDRSQVTAEQTKIGGTATVLTGRDDAYAWDTAGNRAATAGTTHNGSTAAYTTNALNQYTQRTVPGVFDVAGAAGSSATVYINGVSPTRHGDYFFQGFQLNNASAKLTNSVLGVTPQVKSLNGVYTFNWQNRAVTTPTVTGPTGASVQVLEFGGSPDHVGVDSPQHAYTFQNGHTYTFGFWARTTSGTRIVYPGLTDDVNSGLTTGTFTIDTNWKWVTVTKTYSTVGASPRLFYNWSDSGADFQVYGAQVADITDVQYAGILPAFTAGTPEPFTYDDDGNLTRDGRWVYVYDAENRLIAQYTRGAPNDDPNYSTAANVAVWNSGVARQKLVFTNDYLGRRVGKLLSNWDAVNSVWQPALSLKFLYDGWNLVQELDALASLTKVRAHVWGLDWSGTLQGAGGVGGLLYSYHYSTSTTLLPMFDGNGNVMGMIKASDGTIAAAYEYDAFGNTLRESGSHAAANPFRFSTKYTDTETGLVYYGLRYYSPTLGRFINRDPIEEQGGLNLYGFCSNNGVNRWDYLGMNEDDGIPLDGPERWYYEEFIVAARHSQRPVYAYEGFASLGAHLDAAFGWVSASADTFSGALTMSGNFDTLHSDMAIWAAQNAIADRTATVSASAQAAAAQGQAEAAAQGIAPGTTVSVPVTQDGVQIGAVEIVVAPNSLAGVHAGYSDGIPTDGGLAAMGGTNLISPADQARFRVGMGALLQVGSTAWDGSVARGNFPEGSNKCNLFVSEMTELAGASAGFPNAGGRLNRLLGAPYPPLAGQWADPAFAIPGWRVLGSGEAPQFGDVAAQRIHYVDATGHVAIVTAGGRTTGTSEIVHQIATTDWGFRSNQQGQVVYRRWEGSNGN